MRLRPFFSYYGSKYRLAPKYPVPAFNLIVEPFAGSASYACAHYTRDVILVDKDPVIASVWDFLINATRADILALPLEISDLRQSDLPLGARYLIGFWLVRCGSSPANKPHAWMRSGLHNTSFWSADKRQRVADQAAFIKHWQFIHASYEDLPALEATWFIDPPYCGPGSRYRFNEIDYDALAVWCVTRDGQVIATEQKGAEWLPFSYFDRTRSPNVRGGSGSRNSVEVAWFN